MHACNCFSQCTIGIESSEVSLSICHVHGALGFEGLVNQCYWSHPSGQRAIFAMTSMRIAGAVRSTELGAFRVGDGYVRCLWTSLISQTC